MCNLYTHHSVRSGIDFHGTNKSNIPLGMNVSTESLFVNAVSERAN